MATWGDFIAEVTVVRPSKTEGLRANSMYVAVDQVISIWEERNTLRAEAQQLRTQAEQAQELLASERGACAQDVEDFAQACDEEGSEQSQMLAQALRAAAQLIRDRGTPPEAGEIPVAETIDPALAGADIPTADPIHLESPDQ